MEDNDPPLWRRPQLWLAAGLLLLILLLIAFCSGGGEEQGSGGGPPIVTVAAAEAEQQVWSEELTAIGTLKAIQGVDVTTEIAGVVSAIAFRNGESAQAGETLVRLDTTTEQAERASLIAQRNRARLAYDRALRLIERGAIAEAELEQARAEWQNLVAEVRRIEAVIEKKRIDAPFSGILGIRQVSLGEYVAPGAAIAPLQQLAPIYVNFELPERTFPQIRTGLPVRLTTDAFAERVFEGRVTAINPQIAEETRSYTVQATIPNRDRALRPGMFADVTVDLPGTRQVVVVPSTAIARNAYGDIIYVVDRLSEDEAQRQRQQAQQQGGGAESGDSGGEGGQSSEGAPAGEQQQQQQPRIVARSVFIEVGETRGLHTAVEEGIEPGMRVITAGQLKLQDGAPIRIAERDALEGAEPVPDAP